MNRVLLDCTETEAAGAGRSSPSSHAGGQKRPRELVIVQAEEGIYTEAMTDPLAILNGVRKTLDTLTSIRDKIQDAEARNAIADLKMAMADLKESIVELREENVQLRSTVDRLSSPPELAKREGCYVRVGEDGSVKDGPYCTRCFEADGRTITLSPLPVSFQSFGTHICPECKANFSVSQE